MPRPQHNGARLAAALLLLTALPTAAQPGLKPLPRLGPKPPPIGQEVFASPLTPPTRTRFEAVCQTLARHPVVKGDFVQTKHLSRVDRFLVSQGFFAVDTARGMLWDTREPFASTTAVGLNFVVQHSQGKSTRMDASGNETFLRMAQTLRAVFSGDTKTLDEAFEVFFREEKGVWLLGLRPKEASLKNFVQALVLQGDSVVRQLLLLEKNGDSIAYALFAHSFPAELSADEKALFGPP
ncbi:MAG: outer membrane lipoprotein carrier protein LolA [Cystobacterineae bacterium]|nr:outer membrane lipoprotein carrier protein LolA [Cystobacterineae bacterium]